MPKAIQHKAHVSPRTNLPSYTPAQCAQMGRKLNKACSHLKTAYWTNQTKKSNEQWELAEREFKAVVKQFPDFAGYSKKAMHQALALNHHLKVVDHEDLISPLEDLYL